MEIPLADKGIISNSHSLILKWLSALKKLREAKLGVKIWKYNLYHNLENKLINFIQIQKFKKE